MPPTGDVQSLPLTQREIAFAVDAISSQVAMLDAGNRVIWTNQAFAHAYTCQAGSNAPRALSEVLQGERLADVEALLQRIRSNGRAVRFTDAPKGLLTETTLWPIEGGKVLVVANPLVTSVSENGAPTGHDAPERVDLPSNTLGPLDKLSKREREIVGHLGAGRTIKQIAVELGRSEKTIEGHRDSIYRKLSVSSRAGLAVLAIRAGLMKLDSPSQG